MKIFCESQEMMRPTEEWLRKNYNRLNKKLFDGALTKCDFEVFTGGKGSEGRTFGKFKIRGPVGDGLYIDSNRRMYYIDGKVRIYVDKDDFYEDARPEISMNGHYSADEGMWLEILAHEMCHLYTYMHGFAPKQAHGRDFRDIASRVTAKSDGRFNISTFVDTIKWNNKFKLDADIMQKKTLTRRNKAANVVAILARQEDGTGKLILLNRKNYALIGEVVATWLRGRKSAVKPVPASKSIVASTDPEVTGALLDTRKRVARSFKYYIIFKERMPRIQEMFDKGESRPITDDVDRLEIMAESADDFDGGDLRVTPDMNLSNESPFEYD